MKPVELLNSLDHIGEDLLAEAEQNVLATLLRYEQRRLRLRRCGGCGWSGLSGSVLFLGWLWLGLVLQEVVESFIDGGEGGGTDLINPGG